MKMVVEMAHLSLVERWAVLIAQTVHYIVCILIFAVYPRMGFRLMGYLLEESSVIMTHMINDLDMEKVASVPPTYFCIEFWGLASGGLVTSDRNRPQEERQSAATIEGVHNDDLLTLRDVVLLMRGDEMHYRDMDHGIANRIDAERDAKSTGTSAFQ
jgi:hypothetical protein